MVIWEIFSNFVAWLHYLNFMYLNQRTFSEVPKTPFLSVGSNENALFGEAKLRADDVGNETLEKPFWLLALENPFKAKPTTAGRTRETLELKSSLFAQP